MYVLIYSIYFSVFDLLHSVKQALGSFTSLERLKFDTDVENELVDTLGEEWDE